MRTPPRPAAAAPRHPDTTGDEDLLIAGRIARGVGGRRRAKKAGALAYLGLLAATFLATADAPAAPWTMILQQVGGDGAAVGTAIRLACPNSGCATTFPLAIGRETHEFHLQVAFVATGAYLTIVQRSPAIRAVMDFTTGHKGPTFVPLRSQNIDTKLVKLVVAGASDPGNPVLASGPVFNTKMRPDAYLRVIFERDEPKPK